MVQVLIEMDTSWVQKPNPEDRINRKPEDQKTDQRTKNAKNHKTQKMNSAALNLIYFYFEVILGKWKYVFGSYGLICFVM